MNHAEAEQRRTRERKMRQFASHAALSVVIDAALLHLLRVNYFLDPPDDLPYEAEAQLLLSPLCAEIDDGLYVIEPDRRDLLLQALVKDYGGARLRDVARLLWEYCERGAQWLSRPGLAEAQQLTALNFIDPQRALAWLERAERASVRGREAGRCDRPLLAAAARDRRSVAALATTGRDGLGRGANSGRAGRGRGGSSQQCDARARGPRVLDPAEPGAAGP
jgi:hypothetical protein